MTTQVSKQFEALAERAEATLRERAAGDPIRIQVGSATCEQAAGSEQVFEEFRKHIAASGREISSSIKPAAPAVAAASRSSA